MCETFILDLVNLALNKQSHQSSVFFGNNANRGNDGNTDNTLAENSCFHTKQSPSPPWWSVDLGVPSTVYKVTAALYFDIYCLKGNNSFML